MTRLEYISSENLTSQLREIWNLPAFKDAIEIVRREGAPAYPNNIKGDLLHQAALNGAKAHGWSEALAAIEGLTRFQTKQTISQEQIEYTHSAKARMLATGMYTEKEIDELISQQPTQ